MLPQALHPALSQPMIYTFNARSIVTPVPMTPETRTRSASSRKISTKLLCDISGTRYYESNEEIDLEASKTVNIFD